MKLPPVQQPQPQPPVQQLPPVQSVQAQQAVSPQQYTIRGQFYGVELRTRDEVVKHIDEDGVLHLGLNEFVRVQYGQIVIDYSSGKAWITWSFRDQENGRPVTFNTPVKLKLGDNIALTRPQQLMVRDNRSTWLNGFSPSSRSMVHLLQTMAGAPWCTIYGEADGAQPASSYSLWASLPNGKAHVKLYDPTTGWVEPLVRLSLYKHASFASSAAAQLPQSNEASRSGVVLKGVVLKFGKEEEYGCGDSRLTLSLDQGMDLHHPEYLQKNFSVLFAHISDGMFRDEEAFNRFWEICEGVGGSPGAKRTLIHCCVLDTDRRHPMVMLVPDLTRLESRTNVLLVFFWIQHVDRKHWRLLSDEQRALLSSVQEKLESPGILRLALGDDRELSVDEQFQQLIDPRLLKNEQLLGVTALFKELLHESAPSERATSNATPPPPASAAAVPSSSPRSAFFPCAAAEQSAAEQSAAEPLAAEPPVSPKKP